MKGTITKLASFGAFARVKGGLEGLIHLSELSYDKIDVPSDVVSEGQEVEVKIIKIEEERKRLGLSLLLDKDIEEKVNDGSEIASNETSESIEESSQPDEDDTENTEAGIETANDNADEASD